MDKVKFGRTFAVKFIHCGKDLNGEELEASLRKAAESVGATVLGGCHHDFEPQGATAVVMLSESHYALHSWPEEKAVAGSFHTCGEIDSYEAVRLVAKELGTEMMEIGVYDYDDKEVEFFEI